MGRSHMQVPGPDGFRGYGGHCFPKDTKALVHYAKKINVDMPVLTAAMFVNDNTYRNL